MDERVAAELRSSAYLEDGTELFRVVDTVDGADPQVWLENCRTLSVEPMPVGVLLKRKLRRVKPAKSS